MARRFGRFGVVALLAVVLALASAGAAVARTESTPGQAAKADVIIRYSAKPGKAERARLRKQNEAEIKFAYESLLSR